MQIVTGYEGQAHITSNDDQGRNQGTFGEDSYVLSVGSKFAPTLLSANSLKIADGEGVHQGVHFRVDPGTYDTVTIDNGEQGKNRKDLVVCRYTKDGGTGVESCEWVVIKGTASSGTATRPSHTTGDILNGSLTVDMPFFEVVLSGINVSAVNTLFSTLKTMKGMQSDISTLNTNLTMLIKRVEYTATYSITAGGTATITGDDLGIVVPSGYKAIGHSRITTGATDVVVRGIVDNVAGTNGVVYLVSIGVAHTDITCTYTAVYAKSSFVDG